MTRPSRPHVPSGSESEAVAPKRIQRRRTKGWRMPRGAVYVGRPTVWGNPLNVTTDYDDPKRWWVVQDHRDGSHSELDWYHSKVDAKAAAAAQFADDLASGGPLGIAPQYPSANAIRHDLAGRDLACWCPLDQPCHADVLLELANPAQPARTQQPDLSGGAA